MAGAFVMTVEQLPQVVVLHVTASHLDKHEMEGLCATLDKARETSPALPFIMDMAKVDFAGSIAMGILVGLSQEFRGRGQRLIFAGLQPNMHKAFQIARLYKLMEIMPDVAEAIKSAGG